MKKILYSRQEIEQIVVMHRLYLYNREQPCGAKAIRCLLDQQALRPLPSISTIQRILSQNGLTHARTGFYP
jgi:putative transposase